MLIVVDVPHPESLTAPPAQPDDVEQAQTVIASHDIVAADAYAATPVRLDRGRYPLYQSRQMGSGTLTWGA
jgi:hypothetical protein